MGMGQGWGNPRQNRARSARPTPRGGGRGDAYIRGRGGIRFHSLTLVLGSTRPRERGVGRAEVMGAGRGRGKETALGWDSVLPRSAVLLSLSRLASLHQTPAPRPRKHPHFHSSRPETSETELQALP